MNLHVCVCVRLKPFYDTNIEAFFPIIRFFYLHIYIFYTRTRIILIARANIDMLLGAIITKTISLNFRLIKGALPKNKTKMYENNFTK